MFLLHSIIASLAFLSVMVSLTRNVFMSLMYGILLFVNACAVLLGLGFEFLALVNVLVYVGALAVLFLFVIMLLEIPTTELRAYYRGYSALAMLCFISIRLGPCSICEMTGGTKYNPVYCFVPTLESVSSVGYAFYILYTDVLVLNSLILTIALIGALVLAHKSN